jgi:hypothetical protein
MKKLLYTLIILVIPVAFTGCNGKGTGKKGAETSADTITVPDTGFTGIKQYMSGQYVVSEVTFKNGVRHGLMKSFYQGGEVRTTFWYENGLKQDSARWYYPDGKLFRTTPFRNDTVDGIQKQFYRTGKVRARIGFSKGLRTPFIQEYSSNGKLITGYPEILVNVTDEYKTKGIYRIGLELSDLSTKVKFYKGDFIDGRFDTLQVRHLSTVKGKTVLVLKKSNETGPGSVSVIAEIITSLGNKYLTSKKIELPYNDLK